MIHQLERVDGRYYCDVCRQSWKHEPGSECPGVMVYQWGAWPEHLLTKKQMDDAGFQTGTKLPDPAAVVFRAKSPGGKMWLYDRDNGVPKRQMSDVARRGHQEQIAQMQIGWHCQRCGDRLRRYVAGGGLCDRCWDHAAAAEWASAILAKQPPALILDSETTALDGEIIQLAIIDTAGTILLNTLVQPQNPAVMFDAIETGVSAYQIHGIRPERLANAPTFPEIYEQIRHITDGRQVVIYNAAFDIGRLDSDCHRHKLPKLKTDDWDCAMLEYARWYGQYSHHWEDYRWQPLNGGHDAVGDCQAVLQLLHEMTESENIKD